MDFGFDNFKKNCRGDLVKAFVLTKEIDANQLKAELYSKIGPELGGFSESELYVISTDKITEKPSYLNYELKRHGWKVSAVFIRGEVNPDFPGKMIVKAGRILQNGLTKLKEKYGEDIKWDYGLANELNTRNAIESYDRNLAKKEFLN